MQDLENIPEIEQENEPEKFEEGYVKENSKIDSFEIDPTEWEKIKDSPYEYICEFYEKMYPRIGRKTWSVLSLMPCSILIPKINSEFKQIKQKISLLWISPSGSGKSSMAHELNKIAYNPMMTQSITPARLNYEIEKRSNGEEIPKISLIVSDIAQLFSNEEFIKLLEGAIGEESEISRSTMKNKKRPLTKKIDAIAYLSGTSKNIFDAKVRDGILGRTSSLITFFSEEDNSYIINHLNSRMGKPIKIHSVDIIKKYYQTLYDIQLGISKEFNPIEGYIIPEEIVNEIGLFILALKPLKVILEKWGLTSTRSLEQTYRFLVNSAYLNFFNRKVIDNELLITSKDLEVAKKLTARECVQTYRILKGIEAIDQFNIQTERDLRAFEFNLAKTNKKIPDDMGYIMRGGLKK